MDIWSQRKPLTAGEQETYERYLREILIRLGMEPDAPGTRATPRRFLAAWREMTAGYDPDSKLSTTFPRECGDCGEREFEHTVQGPLYFVALCEHHGLPFTGHAWVGYVCGETIIGISKLARIVSRAARRFTLQERIAHDVVEMLQAFVKPRGTAVVIRAAHSCMQFRGVREPHADTVTSLFRGIYGDHPDLRAEFEARMADLRPPALSR